MSHNQTGPSESALLGLLASDATLELIRLILVAIRDTDGVKKITDAVRVRGDIQEGQPYSGYPVLIGGVDYGDNNEYSVRVNAASGDMGVEDTTAHARLGEVQTSPTANTVLDRLKTLNTTLTKVWTHATNQETSTGTKTLIAAAGAGVKFRLKSISIINNDTLDGYVALQENGATGDVAEKIYLPAFGGQWNFEFPGEGRRAATANKALEMVITTCDDVSWIIDYDTV